MILMDAEAVAKQRRHRPMIDERKRSEQMLTVVVRSELAETIRQSNDPIELVDEHGERLGMVRRQPSKTEIEFAKARIGSEGPRFTVDELIAKIEAL